MTNALVNTSNQTFDADHPFSVLKREMARRLEERNAIEQLMQTFVKELFNSIRMVYAQTQA